MVKKNALTHLIGLLLLVFAAAACNQAKPLPPANPEQTPSPTAIPEPAPNTLTVYPTAVQGTVHPYFFGSNYGPWVAVPVEMLPYAFDSGVKSIRFPGGAWGDRNELKSYQIDFFMDFVEQVGAFATISVNLRDGTPEQAAELVRYVNIEKEYGVTYWAIGNEPTLYAAELQTSGRADDYDTEQYNREWREFAEAMKAVDPTIKLLGPEVHQFMPDPDRNPKDSADRDWMTEFLKANGDVVDVVTFHRYPFPRGTRDTTVTVEDLRQHSREWRETIPYLRSLIAEHTGREIPIALTEVSTDYTPAVGGNATPDSHYAGIWLAEMFGQLMLQDVMMVNHWLLGTSGSQGGWGLIARGGVRPTYYVYQLYKQFGTELVYAASGVENLSIYAAERKDGALTIMVVNLADDAQQATLQIDGLAEAQAERWQLTAEQNPESAAPLTISAEPLTFSAQSVSLLIINK